MATPKQIRRRGRWTLFIGVVLAALMLGAVYAYADTISADTDQFATSPPQANGFTGTQTVGTNHSYDWSVTINNNGNIADDVFASGSTVAFTVSCSGPSDWTISCTHTGFTQSDYGQNDAGTVNAEIPLNTINTGSQSVLVDVRAVSSNGKSLSPNEGNIAGLSGRVVLHYNITAGGSTNHAPTVTVVNPSVEVNEGSQATNSGTYADADGDAVSLSASYGTVTKDPNGNAGTWSWSATPDDGPSDSQMVTITATDSHNASGTGSFDLTVNNVAPTMGSITGPTNVLTGSSYSYTYSVSATDPSSADTTAGFNWAWDPGTGTFGAYTSTKSSSPNTSPAISFSSCGSSTVRAKAKDKDGGEASPASLNVSAYDGKFLPPLTAGIYNAVQKGQVVPVKISIGCNGSFLTELTPLINLKGGDADPSTDLSDPTVNVATSVSNADTSGQMRPIDGGYIYNLAVPSNASVGSLFTIYVRPFGGTSPVMMCVLKIRK